MQPDSRFSAAAPAIALDKVELSLGSGAARVHILKGISLNIGQGDTVCVVRCIRLDKPGAFITRA